MIKVSSEADRVLVAKFNEAAQEQVFARWDCLKPEEQNALLEQLRSINLELVRKLIAQYLQGTQVVLESRVLTPAPVLKRSRSPEDQAAEKEAREIGEDVLRKGQVGILTAAGDLGTGAAADKPRGLYPIGPVTGKTLFQLHAERIRAVANRYRASLPWIIATSPESHESILAHFREKDYFGLNRADVTFLLQEALPVVNFRGKFLLAAPGRIALSATGHGGILQRLLADEPFGSLEVRGLEHLFYFQVNNPLVRIADPTFLGHHIRAGSEFSCKTVDKVDPDEKVGIICRYNGALGIIEYSELGEEDRHRRTPDGSLEFGAANIGIHAFSMSFLRRLREEGFELSYHFARRKTPYIDRKGNQVVPRQPNSIQFESYIFDTLPLSRTNLVVETRRDEEFSPVKSLQGRDSIVTAKQDLSRLFARWLREAGAAVRTEGPGAPGAIEISPLLALDAEELRSKLREPIEVREGFYLE